MKHHKVLLFLSVLILQAFCGFVLPRDAPDGLMAWTEEDDGTTTNYTLMTQDSLSPSPLNSQMTALLRRGMGMRTKDTDRSAEKEFEVSDLPALPITRAGCGTEDRITEDEFLEVSWKLKAYCHMQQARGHKIARRSIVAMHQGKTVSKKKLGISLLLSPSFILTPPPPPLSSFFFFLLFFSFFHSSSKKQPPILDMVVDDSLTLSGLHHHTSGPTCATGATATANAARARWRRRWRSSASRAGR